MLSNQLTIVNDKVNLFLLDRMRRLYSLSNYLLSVEHEPKCAASARS